MSSGTEAVFTSTPTALTQSSTTASRFFASLDCETSCWYWPTPIDFGSIFTSSASGSCRRRAIDTAPRIDTSRSGNSLAASSEAEYTEAPASETTIFCNRASGYFFMTSWTSLSVSRLAVPLPMAISVTPCAEARRAMVEMEPPQSFARFVRVDGGGVEQLAGGVDDGDLAAGADARVDAHGHVLAGRRGEQQILQVLAEDADGFFLGALAQFVDQFEFEVGIDLDLPGPAHGVLQPFVGRGGSGA